jgi:hypothetical protein
MLHQAPSRPVLLQVLSKGRLETHHKQICQFLNVGDGAVQVRTHEHIEHFEKLEELFQSAERNIGENEKRFFKLLRPSTTKK